MLGDIATAFQIKQSTDEQADAAWRLHEVCMLTMCTFSHNACKD